MDILTLILFIFIIVFLVGNILLFFLLDKHQKKFDFSETQAKYNVLNSKLEVLNKRVSLLEENNRTYLKFKK